MIKSVAISSVAPGTRLQIGELPSYQVLAALVVSQSRDLTSYYGA
jgi:hypothetical protein